MTTPYGMVDTPFGYYSGYHSRYYVVKGEKLYFVREERGGATRQLDFSYTLAHAKEMARGWAKMDTAKGDYPPIGHLSRRR